MGNRQDSQAKITPCKLCWYSRSHRQLGAAALKYHGSAPGKASSWELRARSLHHPVLGYQPGTRTQLSVPSGFGCRAKALRATWGQQPGPEGEGKRQIKVPRN